MVKATHDFSLKKTKRNLYEIVSIFVLFYWQDWGQMLENDTGSLPDDIFSIFSRNNRQQFSCPLAFSTTSDLTPINVRYYRGPGLPGYDNRDSFVQISWFFSWENVWSSDRFLHSIWSVESLSLRPHRVPNDNMLLCRAIIQQYE